MFLLHLHRSLAMEFKEVSSCGECRITFCCLV